MSQTVESLRALSFHKSPGRVRKPRPADFPAVVEFMKRECRWDVQIPGRERSAEIDLQRFGELPEGTLKRLQMLADESAEFSGIDLAVDRFNIHHRDRRRWRNKLPVRWEEYGMEIVKPFKANALAGNTITALMAVSRVAERGIDQPGVLEKHVDILGPILSLTSDIAAVGGRACPGERYAEMKNRDKKGIAKDLKMLANEVLDYVNPPQSATSKD